MEGHCQAAMHRITQRFSWLWPLLQCTDLTHKVKGQNVDQLQDLVNFINYAWTPYHAVEEASKRLMQAGFQVPVLPSC
jgi:hypothetical protein